MVELGSNSGASHFYLNASYTKTYGLVQRLLPCPDKIRQYAHGLSVVFPVRDVGLVSRVDAKVTIRELGSRPEDLWKTGFYDVLEY